MKKIFISANNTDCGKTYTTLKLIKKFSESGYKVGVIKPIETGVKDIPLDGKVLLDEAKKYNSLLKDLTYNDIVPIQFSLPAAPYVCGIADFEKIKNAIKKIEPLCDILLIEGAGGVRVPIRIESGKSGVPKKSPDFLGCRGKMENDLNKKLQVKSESSQVPKLAQHTRSVCKGSKSQVIEMWELAKMLDAKLFLVISSKLGMINDFLLNKYFLDNKKVEFEWAVNLMDESYFEITHPFMKQFSPLFIQKDLDKIAKKLIGE